MAKTRFFNKTASGNAALVLFDKRGVIAVNRLGLLTTIGRPSRQNSCDISIRSSIVSREHGEIAAIDGEYFYRDLDSRNGTYINDVPVGRKSPEKMQAKKLHDGDILCFGARRGTNSVPDGVIYGLFTLFVDTKREWGSLELRGDIAEILVGRSVQSGLQIDSDMISEQHASFFRSANS